MRRELQLLAIAESQGWKRVTDPTAPLAPKEFRLDSLGVAWTSLASEMPDYLGDRNAMHDALVFLFEEGIECRKGGQALSSYALELDKIVSRDHRGETTHRRLIPSVPQMAEAFLKTINRWTDE